jgi:hypothetical protein
MMCKHRGDGQLVRGHCCLCDRILTKQLLFLTKIAALVVEDHSGGAAARDGDDAVAVAE